MLYSSSRKVHVLLCLIEANILLYEESLHMKLIRKITSTILLTGIIAGSAVTSPLTEMSVDAAGSKVMYNTVVSQFKSRIDDEMKKFPNGSYWNHKGKSSISDETISNIPCSHFSEKVNGSFCSKTKLPSNKECGQCYGFAYKLAKDIWGTTNFRSKKVDGNYEPKVGDNVRLEIPVDSTNAPEARETQPHSIFITSVDGDNITFAECNGELEDCEIIWGRTEYYTNVIATNKTVKNSEGKYVNVVLYLGNPSTLTVVNKAYLRKYADTYDRPIIAGDLNENDRLDNEDASIFANTVMTNGYTLDSKPLSYYDVNGDGHVDTNDYNEIRYGSNNMRIVMSDEFATCRWNKLLNGAFNYSNGYYIINNNGGVSFFGVKDTDCTSFEIPSIVYNSADKKYYTVTEIGYPTEHAPSVKAIQNLTNVIAPDTIRKIHDGAFFRTKLQNITFKNAPTGLTEIGSYAFYGTKLTSFNFPIAKNLKKIGNYAFDNTAITTVDLSQNTALETIDYSAFKNNTNIISVSLPYSLVKVGDSAFEGCTQLTNVTVKPNQYNTCKLEQFGANAFRGCKSLNSVTIPEYYRSLTVGNNGVGAFDVNSTHKVTLTVPHNYSPYKAIYLHGSDSTAFKNGYLIIKGGRVNIYGCTSNSNSTLITSKSSRTLTTVTK